MLETVKDLFATLLIIRRATKVEKNNKYYLRLNAKN
jgi:hypothetical protein